MAGSNTRSNLLGTIAAALPFIGASLGVAVIAGATGCHLELLAIPFALIMVGAISAVVIGAAAVRLRRSKRGLVMPGIAIGAGVSALIWLATIAR